MNSLGGFGAFGAFGIGMMVFVIIIALGIYLAIYIPYLLNMQNMLKECNHKSLQGFNPSNVWLLLIPLFSIVYQFILYNKNSEILQREYALRGRTKPGDYSKSLGLTLAILSVVSAIPDLPIPLINGISSIAGLGSLVIFIIYWVKMAEYKNDLRKLPKESSGSISSNPDLLD